MSLDDKSYLEVRHSNITQCSADISGGGVTGSRDSTLLCVDCLFYNNTVGNGNGGALHFDAESDHALKLQLVRSRVENNAAEFGGDWRPLEQQITVWVLFQGEFISFAVRRVRSVWHRVSSVRSWP